MLLFRTGMRRRNVARVASEEKLASEKRSPILSRYLRK